MATVEQATRLAIRSFTDLTGIEVAEDVPVHRGLQAILDWRVRYPRPSGGEAALSRLPFALWNGSDTFGVGDLATLDKQRRHEALEAITTWVEATVGPRAFRS